jgi:hypothetical protein
MLGEGRLLRRFVGEMLGQAALRDEGKKLVRA